MRVINDNYKPNKRSSYILMKTFSSLAIFSLLLAPSAFATHHSTDYVATKAENDKFCAKIELYAVGRGSYMKTKCRTIKQWKAAGYDVTIPAKPELKAVEDKEEKVV